MNVLCVCVQDSFTQILYMYMSEGVPVGLQHARSGRSGLMAAAARGLPETVAQMLQIGERGLP